MSIESVIGSGRRLVDSTLLDVGLVRHRTLTPDGSGGRAQTWVDGETVRCRFGNLVDPEPEQQVSSVYGPATAQILMPLGTVAAEGDHVVNVDTDKVWLIVGDKTPESNLAVIKRVLVREAD